MEDDAPLLICYDGSDGARQALEVVPAVTGPRRAVIACYWQPFADSGKRFAIHVLETVQDRDDLNGREEALAQEVAEEGAEAYRELGGEAEAVAVRVSAPIEVAIVQHADELGAAAIVLGARGRSALGSVLLGNVTSDVVQLTSRPVFLVPDRRLASRRRTDREREAETSDID